MSLVVILGMHRSGTSCLTHMLHRAGLDLGEGLLADGKSDNLGGHWEAAEAMTINELILMLSGGTWNRVPDQLQTNDTIDQRMARFVAQFEGAALAGWKDPRTTLTFPFWKPHLNHYRLVVCLRHPLAVARSLAARHHGTIDEGLELWLTYYRHLMQYLPQEPAVDWFDYDAPRDRLRRQVVSICQSLGLHVDNQVLATFNEQLRHQSATDAKLPADVARMYDHLRGLATQNMRERGVADDDALGGGSEPCDPLDELRSRLDDVIGARRAENLVMQELDARLRGVEAAMRATDEAALVETVARLEAQLEEQARTIGQLRAALPQRAGSSAPHF